MRGWIYNRLVAGYGVRGAKSMEDHLNKIFIFRTAAGAIINFATADSFFKVDICSPTQKRRGVDGP